MRVINVMQTCERAYKVRNNEIVVIIHQEDDSDCGAGTCLRSSLWSMLGLQLLLLGLTSTSTHS
jgi:hypothetical protein